MSPKIRQTLYYFGTIVPAVLGIALIWGGLDAGAADSIGDIVAGLVSLFGAGAPATAAMKIAQQRKDGVFDPVSPTDQVINGVAAVVAAQQTALADLEKVKAAVTTAVGVVPGVGPLAAQLINNWQRPQ